MSRCTWTDEA